MNTLFFYFAQVHALLAQMDTTFWAPFAQVGISGVMLLWFMKLVESRMRSLEMSLDRGAKANLLLVLAYEKNEGTIRAQVNELLAELQAKEAQDRAR